MDIEDIDDHFFPNDNWWGSFDCPNCNQSWGPSDHGDPPGEIDEIVACECGATLKVIGEWVSHYEMEVEQLDDE